MTRQAWTMLAALFLLLASGCGMQEIKPVEIYAEDLCSSCRMAISEKSFASEIITTQGEVFKFDDLGCLETFQSKSANIAVAAKFVRAYDTKEWIPAGRAFIVATGIKTPMGSGRVAFADSVKSSEVLRQYPVAAAERKMGCCAGEEE